MKNIIPKKKRSQLALLSLVGILSLTLMPKATLAAPTGGIVVNGTPLTFGQDVGSPLNIDGRTHVPIRIMADSLGYHTKWDAAAQTATIQNSTSTIELQVGRSTAYVDGEEVYIDIRDDNPVASTTASLRNGRTYVPLRFVTEILGCKVSFENCVTYITKDDDLVSEPITPWEYQKRLGKGMDVDWSKTAQGRTHYNIQTVKDFKEQGISHVRIRVKDEDEADDKLFASLDKQIQDCLDNDLIPIIAYQADAFKNEPSEKNIKKVVAWWKTVSDRYQDVSPLLAFDLLIEATDALNKQPEKLNEIYERIVSEIRETNPTRIIMISPRLRSDAAYLNELVIPSAHNGYLMAEWHFYASGPSKTNARKLWTTGTDYEKALIQEKVNLALSWQERTGIPTWVGAWMPGNYNYENDYSIGEQVTFASYMTSALTKAGIPFAVNSDTKFYDRETNQWVDKMKPVRECIFGF